MIPCLEWEKRGYPGSGCTFLRTVIRPGVYQPAPAIHSNLRYEDFPDQRSERFLMERSSTNAPFALLFDRDYRSRTEIGCFNGARLQFHGWDPFSLHPIEPEFFSDLAEGIERILFKKSGQSSQQVPQLTQFNRSMMTFIPGRLSCPDIFSVQPHYCALHPLLQREM